jgi:hypothetical protein
VEVLRHTGIRVEVMVELTHHSSSPTRWSPPTPFLFQRRFGTEDRPLTRSYIRESFVAMSHTSLAIAAGRPPQWRPHDFPENLRPDAIRTGLPPRIAA